MPERTDIEKLVRILIAGDILYRPLKSLGERGVRRLDKTAKSIYDLIEADGEKGNRVEARVEESEEEKARTLKEGIDEFSKKYPSQGKMLAEMIEQKRNAKNKCLIYGLKEGYKLSEEDYIQTIMDLGFDKREAASIYPHIISYSEREGKAIQQSERKILLTLENKKKK